MLLGGGGINSYNKHKPGVWNENHEEFVAKNLVKTEMKIREYKNNIKMYFREISCEGVERRATN